jgi:hypothetical protein
MSDKYLLDENRNVYPVHDLLTWAKGFEEMDHHVAFTPMPGGFIVSTIFLGLNFNHLSHPPHLFETMVFNPQGHVVSAMRCSTWDQAEMQHQGAVARAGGALQ